MSSAANKSTSQPSAEQLAAFTEKYQIVLSSCRLLTEAQAALDRSVKDFVALTQTISPGTIAEHQSVEQSASAPPSKPASKSKAKSDVPTLASQTSAVDVTGSASEAETSGKKVKKPKKQRDPDQPPRPVSAYFLYQSFTLPEVIKAQPEGATYADAQREVAKRWQELSAEQQKPYTDVYAKHLSEYETKMADYYERTGKEPPKKKVAKAPANEAANASASAPVAATTPAPRPAAPASTPAFEDDDAAAASLTQSTTAATPAKHKKRKNKADGSSEKPATTTTPTPKKAKEGSEDKENKKKRKKSEAPKTPKFVPS